MLTDDVIRLILTSIPTVPHLEALLLLRAQRSTWDAASVARRLYISERVAESVLEDLAAGGFIARDDGGHRYQPATPEQETAVDRLADAHAHHLLEVTDLIHGGKSARLFADAFKIRKE